MSAMTPGIPRPALPGRPAAAVRSSHPRRRSERAVGMVEFALVAPLAFLLLMGLLVLGIVVMNLIQLTNAVRDGARAAAVCGGAGFQSGSTQTLPNGVTCSTTALNSYITSKLQSITGVTPSVTILTSGGTDLTQCSKGVEVKVTASYPQPLYFPLVGRLLGDSGNSAVRTISATGEATCEQ